MKLSAKPAITSIFIIYLYLLPFCGKAQTNVNVRVISDKAGIYTEPDTASSYHIRAEKGDVFQVYQAQNGWVQIQLFSGGKRYVKHIDVEIVHKELVYPSDASIRNKVCIQAEEARRKASEKAMAKYPNRLDHQGIYEDILFDQYMINSFRSFNIPASNYSELMECVNDPLPSEPVKINNRN